MKRAFAVAMGLFVLGGLSPGGTAATGGLSLAGSGALSANSVPVRGDLDHDGFVDGADRRILAEAFGAGGPPPAGVDLAEADLVADGVIDPRDLVMMDHLVEGTYWPNEASCANSDDWIVDHHDALRVMRPRVLVLVFMNDWRQEAEMTDRLIAALALSTRYHWRQDPSAPAFLQYEVAKIVDLRDPPGTQTLDGNSTRYPRVPDWQPGMTNFAYERLYTDEFAAWYGYPDPDHAGRFLTLAELVDRGIVHELWFYACHGNYGAPFETVEHKQYYDAQLQKRPGAHGGAGNGHYEAMPWTGRSLRITFINGNRGIGCALENFGHALEGMAHFDFCPYWREYFYEFAGFDLDARFGLPFPSLYACGNPSFDYPAPDRMTYSCSGQTGTVENYYAVGGNVHFTPAGRFHYDLANTQAVYSTGEHYRLFDGPGGADAKDLWDRSRFAPFESVAPDCMGPWLVYWRQNMPGYGNRCRDKEGRPMKNWWVFLFY